jgi:acetyl esterase/lipase
VLHFPNTCHPKLFPRDKYEFGSYIQNSDNAVLAAVTMEGVSDLYNPELSSDQRINPLLAGSHKNLPPACKMQPPSFTFHDRALIQFLVIQVAGLDILRDEGLAYAEALREAGVNVECHVYSGLPHCFPGFMITLEETKTFYDRYNDFLSRYA